MVDILNWLFHSIEVISLIGKASNMKALSLFTPLKKFNLSFNWRVPEDSRSLKLKIHG